MTMLEDPAAVVRATAVRSLRALLGMVTSFPPSDSNIFSLYIFPALQVRAQARLFSEDNGGTGAAWLVVCSMQYARVGGLVVFVFRVLFGVSTCFIQGSKGRVPSERERERQTDRQTDQGKNI